MNFYQSELWKTINQHIYKKPVFEVSLLWKKYWWITKSQKRFWKTFSWYMVHWLEGFDSSIKTDAQLEMFQHVRRDFGSSSGDIFFQFGFMDTLHSDPTKLIKSDKELISSYIIEREHLEKNLLDTYKLLPSWREHMPDTTNIIDISEWIQHTRTWYSSSGKRYINKAKKEDLTFEIAEAKQWKKFREIWYTMAYDKWFAILPRETFETLMQFLSEEGHGRLMLAKKWSKIVSGSIVLRQDSKKLIYLYWATNREYGNIWGHYWLTDQILKRWAHEWFETYDLLWVAPVWNDKHYLSGVTRFKQSFGGNTITSVWNFDMVFSPRGYALMQFLKKLKRG